MYVEDLLRGWRETGRVKATDLHTLLEPIDYHILRLSPFAGVFIYTLPDTPLHVSTLGTLQAITHFSSSAETLTPYAIAEIPKLLRSMAHNLDFITCGGLLVSMDLQRELLQFGFSGDSAIYRQVLGLTMYVINSTAQSEAYYVRSMNESDGTRFDRLVAAIIDQQWLVFLYNDVPVWAGGNFIAWISTAATLSEHSLSATHVASVLPMTLDLMQRFGISDGNGDRDENFARMVTGLLDRGVFPVHPASIADDTISLLHTIGQHNQFVDEEQANSIISRIQALVAAAPTVMEEDVLPTDAADT